MTLFRSWLRWLVLPASLLALLMLGMTLLLANLDHPRFKSWLNRQLAFPFGITVDYRRVDFAPLNGRLLIEGLQISSPEVHLQHTPLLLDLGHLSAHWSNRSLLSRKFTVREFKIDSLAVHAVVQEDGLSTLDLFRDDTPDEPALPLSHMLQLIDLPMAVLVEHAQFNDLSLSQTELDHRGDLIGRQRLDGIDINATAGLIPGNVSARIQIHSAERTQGLQLNDYQADTQQTRSMDLTFASNLTIDASRNVQLLVKSDLLRQTFDSGLAIGGSIIDIDAQALFDTETRDTKLTLTKLQLLDTAAYAELVANWPDDAPLPLLQTGSGSIHIDPLLAAWPALSPNTGVEGMRLNYRIQGLAGNDQATKLSVEGEAESLRSHQNEQKLDLKNLSLQLNGTIDWPERADFQLSIPVGKVSYRNADASSIELQRALLTVNAENFPMRLDRPFSAGGILNISALKLNSEQTPIEQANLKWSLDNFTPGKAQAWPAHAGLTLTGTLDELKLDANATLQDANLNTVITAQTDKLGVLFRKLPVDRAQLANVNLEKTAAQARLQGRYRNIDQPRAISLDHELSATVTNISVRESELTAEFPVVQLQARHQGGENRHSLDFNFTSHQTRLNNVPLEQDPIFSLNAALAPVKSTARLTLDIGPQLSAVATAEFESSTAILSHNGRLDLKQPAILTKWLPEAHAVDWQTFSAKLNHRGTIAGLLEADADTALPVLAPDFQDKLQASLKIDLDLNDIAYRNNELSIRAPELTLALNGKQRGRKIQARADIAAPSLSIGERSELIELTEMTHQLDITADSRLAGGDIEIRIDSRLKNAAQSYFPLYPISDLSLTGRAHSSRLESFVLDDLLLNNQGGGTQLSLSKTLNRASAEDAGGKQQSSWRELNLNGEITQSLAELDTTPELFQGRGTLSAPITINSSDGALFNIKATLNLNDVNATLPDQELHIDGLNGRVQLSETIEWDIENGISLIHDSERNHFARIRYQDVQPFLSNQSFFKIARLRWKNLEAAPIIGSLHIQNNVFSLNKLKLKKGPGTISGQLIVDYYPGAERLKFRGNATGLKIGESQDRLDGNMAFVFVPAKLEIDGRVQILQLSRQHLVELLDLLDPFREDTALNKLRLALAFGYPNFVRMEMAQGLASMKVDLGGIGGALIDIEEIRGIALGPFMSRHVAPLLQLE